MHTNKKRLDVKRNSIKNPVRLHSFFRVTYSVSFTVFHRLLRKTKYFSKDFKIFSSTLGLGMVFYHSKAFSYVNNTGIDNKYILTFNNKIMKHFGCPNCPSSNLPSPFFQFFPIICPAFWSTQSGNGYGTNCALSSNNQCPTDQSDDIFHLKHIGNVYDMCTVATW